MLSKLDMHSCQFENPHNESEMHTHTHWPLLVGRMQGRKWWVQSQLWVVYAVEAPAGPWGQTRRRTRRPWEDARLTTTEKRKLMYKFVVLLHYTSLYFCMHAGTIISRFITISSQTLSSWNGHAVITKLAPKIRSAPPPPQAVTYFTLVVTIRELQLSKCNLGEVFFAPTERCCLWCVVNLSTPRW